MNNKSSLPRKIGGFLAAVQAIIDDALAYGFKKLKSVGKKKTPPPPADAPLKDKVVHAAQKSAEFIGETGESYFDEYEKRKAKKRNRS